MTLETGGSAPRASGFNWVRALLIASLALNLLFIGGFARAVWSHRHKHERGLVSFARQLPAEKRESFRNEVIEARKKTQPLRGELRTNWRAANEILSEEPFDKAKFRAALDKVVDSERRFRSEIYDTIADAAGKMTAEERRAFQEWRERRHGRRFGRSKHGRKDKGGEDD